MTHFCVFSPQDITARAWQSCGRFIMIYIYAKFNLTFLKLLKRVWCFTNIYIIYKIISHHKKVCYCWKLNTSIMSTDATSWPFQFDPSSSYEHHIHHKYMLMSLNLEQTDHYIMNSTRSIQFPNVMSNMLIKNCTIICNKNYKQNIRRTNQTKIDYWC